MTDLTPYSVVRDARGHLCLIDDGHVTYMGERLDEIEEARSLPVTPILDRDGLPVVRTVGDLTARHIGKRVRVLGVEGALEVIDANQLSIRLIIETGDGGEPFVWALPDIPLEVLP